MHRLCESKEVRRLKIEKDVSILLQSRGWEDSLIKEYFSKLNSYVNKIQILEEVRNSLREYGYEEYKKKRSNEMVH